MTVLPSLTLISDKSAYKELLPFLCLITITFPYVDKVPSLSTYNIVPSIVELTRVPMLALKSIPLCPRFVTPLIDPDVASISGLASPHSELTIKSEKLKPSGGATPFFSSANGNSFFPDKLLFVQLTHPKHQFSAPKVAFLIISGAIHS